MKYVVSLAALLVLASCTPPPPPAPPPTLPPPVTYQAPMLVPPMYTEPAIVTTRRHRGVVTVDRRCPAGMHWVASSRKITKYQQGDRVVRVSKRKAGYCSR